MTPHDVHSPAAPPLLFVMEIRVSVAKPLELGNSLGMARRIVPITGGKFEGPSLRGTVLPGGADWQYTRPDGVAVLEARYTLETDHGDLISVVNHGFRHGKPGLAARFAAGEQVPPAEYYFMTAPLFEAASPALQWLTRTVFVGEGERERDWVVVRVWQVGRDLEGGAS